MIGRTATMFLSVIAFCAACGGGSPAAPSTAAGASHATQSQPAVPTQGAVASQPALPTAPEVTFPAAQPTPASGGGGSAAFHVVVASGPQAGTYAWAGSKVDCNLSPSGSGATGGDTAATQGISSFIFSAVGAGASPTTFYFQLLFAPMSLNPPSIEIDTLDASNPSGSGTATLVDKGSTIQWSIDGKTKDGVAVTASIECGPVDRPTSVVSLR